MLVRFPRYIVWGVLIVQALTLGILVWNSARLADTGHREWLQHSAQMQNTVLRSALVSRLLDNDQRGLLSILEGLRSNSLLHHAAIFNRDRELLVSLGDHRPLAQQIEGDFRYRQIWDRGLLIIEQPIAFQGQVLGIMQTGYVAVRVNDLVKAVKLQNSVVALVGLLLSAIVIGLAVYSTRRGLSHLQAGLQQLQEGRLEHRIPDAGGVIGPVITAVNNLATEIASKRAEILRQYDRALQESRRLNNLLHGINAVVWEAVPETGCFQYMGAEIERLSGYTAEQWLRPDFYSRYVHPADLIWLQDFLGHAPSTADTFNLDFRLFNQDGETLWLRLISTVEMRTQGPVLTGLLLNVSEEKRNEQRITYLADHDPLTGLINRRCFQERLEQQVAYSQRYQTPGALLFVDLDQFKDINDSYGHQVGDDYLRQVAYYLRDLLRETSTLGRLDGDKFGIILPNVDIDETRRVAEAVLSNLYDQYFSYQDQRRQDQRVRFSASMGVVLFPEQGNKAGELLVKADSALHTAKDQGRNTYRIFSGNIDTIRMQERTQWGERIRTALEANRFQLYFQPVVDIHTGVINHYESLVRMSGDNGELIAPSSFIGIAEYMGAIREIDRWVVANTIRVQSQTERSDHPKVLAINLSGQHFGSREILAVIQETTRRYRANPAHIIFEISETNAVEHYKEACDFFEMLRDLGYQIILDDFGAGFSSFHHLKHMPVDYVKIDGSLVRGLAHDRVSRIFVSAIAEMLGGLEIKVIAESVEDAEVLEVLRQLSIPLAQGYLFAEPGPDFYQQPRIILAD